MTTIAGQDATPGDHASLEAEIRHLLAAHFPYPALVPEKLVRSLVLAAGGYAAVQVDKHARSPVSQRGPGRQQRERKTA